MRLLRYLFVVVAIIVAGLVWRMIPMGFPAGWVKYGGSALWGAMIMLVIGAFIRRPLWLVFIIAVTVTTGTECFRLYHAQGLDAFRLTLAGGLLIGRVFDPWNIVVYALGVAAALPLHIVLRRSR